MTDYTDEAKELLKAIGGQSNINNAWHCATRLRFVLNDDSKADVQAIENLKDVKGTFTQAGQFQVIIGNTVGQFFEAFSKVAGISESSKAEVKAAGQAKQNVFQRGLSFMSDVFTPIIPAFIIGGLILGFRNILDGIPFASLGQHTIVEVSTFWSGVDQFLWLPGEAIFQFLPVAITWSVTRKMRTTQILGIILGITLVTSQLLNAYDAPQAILDGTVPVWDFGFFQLQKIGYQGQVLPALFAGLALGHFERFWRRHTPEYLSMILVPFLSLLPAVILAHTILGPIGWRIGTWIGRIVLYGLTGPVKWLFGLLFGAFYSPLVITGLHHMTNAVDAQLIGDYHGTQLWPMIALSNIAQASATLGVWWLTRHDEKETQLTIPATISAALGVTEPALYGVTLKKRYPMVAAMIGSGIAGLVSVASGVTANSIGVGGIPGFLVIQLPSMLAFFIAMGISLLVPFLLTLAFHRAQGLPIASASRQSMTTTQPKPTTPLTGHLVAPVSGKLISLEQVPDQVFSSKAMGEGFAIDPDNGQILSPHQGTVTTLFPTKHAIGITLANGLEILIHMGLDTVELNGAPFELLVKEGETVNSGTPIATMDLEAIKQSHHSPIVVVVITNSEKLKHWQLQPSGHTTSKQVVGEYQLARNNA